MMIIWDKDELLCILTSVSLTVALKPDRLLRPDGGRQPAGQRVFDFSF